MQKELPGPLLPSPFHEACSLNHLPGWKKKPANLTESNTLADGFSFPRTFCAAAGRPAHLLRRPQTQNPKLINFKRNLLGCSSLIGRIISSPVPLSLLRTAGLRGNIPSNLLRPWGNIAARELGGEEVAPNLLDMAPLCTTNCLRTPNKKSKKALPYKGSIGIIVFSYSFGVLKRIVV